MKNYELPVNAYWTKQAVECYQKDFQCMECIIFDIIGTQCQMKRTVMGLIHKFGKPKELK